MNDISAHYPRVPRSLLTNPLDITIGDTNVAREIANSIGAKHRTTYNLDDAHMSVIPGGIRYYAIPLSSGLGRLQITKHMGRYSVIAYQQQDGIPVPNMMAFNLTESEVDEALHLLAL